MKFLSAVLFLIAVIVVLFALVVHIVDNIKGMGPTQWNWKVKAVCGSIAAVLFYFSVKLWGG